MNKNDKRCYVYALGCRVNQYEKDAIAYIMKKAGYSISARNPDVVIVNSCSVTHVAERKLKKLLSFVRKKHNNAIVLLCGCSVENLENIKDINFDIAVGNRLKHKIPAVVEEFLKGNISTPFILREKDILKSNKWDNLVLEEAVFHTRAFLKIQEGCNHFCSYCIVPYLRGKPVSCKPQFILQQIRSLVESGVKEIILTGVHIGLYGKDIDFSLTELIRLIERSFKGTNLLRLRFGSIEPFAITKDLLKALAESTLFCPHLHVPIQSADDKVLKDMGRGYHVKDLLKLFDMIRYFLGDDVNLTTDVLVGFPTETENAFLNTLNFIKEIGFSKLHVFPYSPRKGTKAFSLGTLPYDVVSNRVKEAINLSDTLYERYASKFLGKRKQVLVDKTKNNFCLGYTDNFLRVKIDATFDLGELISVRLSKILKEDTFKNIIMGVTD